jgi:hypothetical protein
MSTVAAGVEATVGGGTAGAGGLRKGAGADDVARVTGAAVTATALSGPGAGDPAGAGATAGVDEGAAAGVAAGADEGAVAARGGGAGAGGIAGAGAAPAPGQETTSVSVGIVPGGGRPVLMPRPRAA